MTPEQLMQKINDSFEDIDIHIRTDIRTHLEDIVINPFKMIVRFPNDYGASIIRTEYSYSKDQEVEIAIIKYQPGDDIRRFEIAYDTHITDDVIGHVKEEEIIDILKQISDL